MERDLPEHQLLLRRYDDLLVVGHGVCVHAVSRRWVSQPLIFHGSGFFDFFGKNGKNDLKKET